MRKFIIGGLAAFAMVAVPAALGAAPANADDIRCRVNASGAMWCEDWDTGQSWEQATQGTYPDNPYCGTPYAPVRSPQCGY